LSPGDCRPSPKLTVDRRPSSALALEVYTKVMERKRDTGARMDALIQGADWAQVGTNGANGSEPLPTPETENPAGAGLS